MDGRKGTIYRIGNRKPLSPDPFSGRWSLAFLGYCEPVLGSGVGGSLELVILMVLRNTRARKFESIVSVRMAKPVLGSFTDRLIQQLIQNEHIATELRHLLFRVSKLFTELNFSNLMAG